MDMCLRLLWQMRLSIYWWHSKWVRSLTFGFRIMIEKLVIDSKFWVVVGDGISI